LLSYELLIRRVKINSTNLNEKIIPELLNIVSGGFQMKKVFLLLVIIIFGISMLFMGVGCKKEAAEEEVAEEAPVVEEAPAEEEAVEVKELRLTVEPGSEPRIKEDVDAFNKIHPDINIIVDVAGEAITYKETAPQIFGSADKPDIAWYWVDGKYFQSMVSAGILESLDDIYESENLYDGYPQSTINAYTSPDGHFYGVNIDVVLFPVIYYNVEAFIQAGITPPDIFPQLDEFYLMITKLKDAGYEGISVGGKDAWTVELIAENLTQRVYSEDKFEELRINWKEGSTPTAHYTDSDYLAAYELLLEFKEKGVFAEGFLARGYGEDRALFLQGEAAMLSDGSWGAGAISSEAPEGFEFGWFLLPQVKSDITPQISIYSGNGLIIPRGGKFVNEAKEFLKFVVSKERQENIAKLGWIPARIGLDTALIKENLGFPAADMWESIDKLGASTSWAQTTPADLGEQRNLLMMEVLGGTITVEELGKTLEEIAESHRMGE